MTATEKNKAAQLGHDIATVAQCIYGNWISQVTYIFAEFGIADIVKDSPKTLDELVDILGVQKGPLKKMLRCTFELKYLEFDKVTKQYRLTERGALLSSDHPHSKREEARLNGAGYRYEPWGNLIHMIRNGLKNEYSPTYEHGSLDYLKDKPELLTTFHKALATKSQIEDYKVIKDYDFSPFNTVMDMGCGRGTLIRTILDENPHLKGIMFDLDFSLEGNIIEEEYKDKLTMEAGSFFESVPDTADVYVMKNVIHNWPEDKATLLMKTVRKAMASTDGISTPKSQKRLLVIENLVPEEGDTGIATWMDLNFMVIVGGDERTYEEYSELGEACGLKLEQAIKTDSGRHIMSYILADEYL